MSNDLLSEFENENYDFELDDDDENYINEEQTTQVQQHQPTIKQDNNKLPNLLKKENKNQSKVIPQIQPNIKDNNELDIDILEIDTKDNNKLENIKVQEISPNQQGLSNKAKDSPKIVQNKQEPKFQQKSIEEKQNIPINNNKPKATNISPQNPGGAGNLEVMKSQYLKLKDQLLKLAIEIDKVVENQQQKQQLNSYPGSTTDTELQEKYNKLKKQQQYINKLKEIINKYKMELKNQCEFDQLTEQSNELVYKKKQLEKILKEQQTLIHIRNNQKKQIDSISNKGEYEKRLGIVNENIRKEKEEYRQASEQILEKQRQLKVIDEEYYTKEMKIKDFIQKIKEQKEFQQEIDKNSENSLQNLTKQTIIELRNQIGQIKSQRIELQQKGEEQIQHLEREKKEIEKLNELTLHELKDKEKDLRMTELRIKEIQRLIKQHEMLKKSQAQGNVSLENKQIKQREDKKTIQIKQRMEMQKNYKAPPPKVQIKKKIVSDNQNIKRTEIQQKQLGKKIEPKKLQKINQVNPTIKKQQTPKNYTQDTQTEKTIIKNSEISQPKPQFNRIEKNKSKQSQEQINQNSQQTSNKDISISMNKEEQKSSQKNLIIESNENLYNNSFLNDQEQSPQKQEIKNKFDSQQVESNKNQSDEEIGEDYSENFDDDEDS